MERLLLNNELLLPCPDGFHPLDEEERAALPQLESGSGAVLSDPARHMLISVGWKQPNGFALLLLTDDEVAKRTEQTVRRAMQRFDYRAEGFLTRTIAGLPAKGFRYGYTAQGVEMCAETCILRRKKTLYYFHCYARAARREESFALWESVLGGIAEQ